MTLFPRPSAPLEDHNTMRRIVIVLSLAALASGAAYAFLRHERRRPRTERDLSGYEIDAGDLTEAEQQALLRELSQYT